MTKEEKSLTKREDYFEGESEEERKYDCDTT